MLLNNFFYINTLEHKDEQIVAGIRIHTEHEILKGHFPDQPVVPGVCVLEMLKEIVETCFSKKYLLAEGSFAKFLKMLTPPVSDDTRFEISYKQNDEDTLTVDAVLKNEAGIFFKFRGLYKKI